MAELTLRVVVSLGVVLGLFWAVARLGSRRLGGRERGLVRVRTRQSLTRGSSLAVVEVGTRLLVVGVSDHGIRLLTELEPSELEDSALEESGLDDESGLECFGLECSGLADGALAGQLVAAPVDDEPVEVSGVPGIAAVASFATAYRIAADQRPDSAPSELPSGGVDRADVAYVGTHRRTTTGSRERSQAVPAALPPAVAPGSAHTPARAPGTAPAEVPAEVPAETLVSARAGHRTGPARRPRGRTSLAAGHHGDLGPEPTGALGGSLLAVGTWRQAFAAARGRTGAPRQHEGAR